MLGTEHGIIASVGCYAAPRKASITPTTRTSSSPTRRLLGLVAPYRGRSALGVLFAGPSSALSVPIPLMIRQVVDGRPGPARRTVGVDRPGDRHPRRVRRAGDGVAADRPGHPTVGEFSGQQFSGLRRDVDRTKECTSRASPSSLKPLAEQHLTSMGTPFALVGGIVALSVNRLSPSGVPPP